MTLAHLLVLYNVPAGVVCIPAEPDGTSREQVRLQCPLEGALRQVR